MRSVPVSIKVIVIKVTFMNPMNSMTFNYRFQHRRAKITNASFHKDLTK